MRSNFLTSSYPTDYSSKMNSSFSSHPPRIIHTISLPLWLNKRLYSVITHSKDDVIGTAHFILCDWHGNSSPHSAYWSFARHFRHVVHFWLASSQPPHPRHSRACFHNRRGDTFRDTGYEIFARDFLLECWHIPHLPPQIQSHSPASKH